MSKYLYKGFIQKAFIETGDVLLELETIQQSIDSDVSVSIADCSGLTRGKDIRLLLDTNAKEIDNSEKRVLLIYGIEKIDEHELRVGLEHFCAFIQAANEYMEEREQLSKEYEYSFNPVVLSVLIILQKDTQKHFLKHSGERIGFGIFDADQISVL